MSLAYPPHSNIFWTPWPKNFPKILLSIHCSPANFWNVLLLPSWHLPCETSGDTGSQAWPSPSPNSQHHWHQEPWDQWTKHHVLFWSLAWSSGPQGLGPCYLLPTTTQHPQSFYFQAVIKDLIIFCCLDLILTQQYPIKYLKSNKTIKNVTIKPFLPHLFFLS